MSACALGRRAGLGSSRARVIGSCELLSVGTGNQTQLLSKSSMCSKVLSHLTNLPFLRVSLYRPECARSLSLFSFLFMCLGTCVYRVCLSVNTPPCQEKVSIVISTTFHNPSQLAHRLQGNYPVLMWALRLNSGHQDCTHTYNH